MIKIDQETEINSVKVVYESELEKMESDPSWVLIAIIQEDTNKFVWGRGHDHGDADNPVNHGNGTVELSAELSAVKTKLVESESLVHRLNGLLKKARAADTNKLIDENHSLRESVAALEADNRHLNSANGNLMVAKDGSNTERSKWQHKADEYKEALENVRKDNARKSKAAFEKIENQRRDIFLGGECLRQIRTDLGEEKVQESIDKILKFSSSVLFGEKRTVECPECDHEVECGNLTSITCSECSTDITVPGWQPFEDRPLISRADES